jgi:hypothetical protein
MSIQSMVQQYCVTKTSDAKKIKKRNLRMASVVVEGPFRAAPSPSNLVIV